MYTAYKLRLLISTRLPGSYVGAVPPLTPLQRILVAQESGGIEGNRPRHQHPAAAEDAPPAVGSVLHPHAMEDAPVLVILIRLHQRLDHVERNDTHPRDDSRPGAGQRGHQQVHTGSVRLTASPAHKVPPVHVVNALAIGQHIDSIGQDVAVTKRPLKVPCIFGITWTNLPAHHGQKAAIEPRDAISLEYPFERAKGGPSLAIEIVTVIYGNFTN